MGGGGCMGLLLRNERVRGCEEAFHVVIGAAEVVVGLGLTKELRVVAIYLREGS